MVIHTKKIAILTLGLLGSTSTFAVTLSSMTKKEINRLLIGNTLVSIATDNLNGKTINNTFSLYLDGKGHAYGSMSIKPKDQPQQDSGTYSINSDGSFHITWKHWDEAKKLCGHFYETQNAILAISCDKVFHTVFMKESIKQGKAQ